jgi:GTP-binding protein
MSGRKEGVVFVGSFRENFPEDHRKHVVFVGRSNVGKSSLINMLVGRKVAHVSKEPGRTRAINFFLWDDGLYLVDVPGYGYAKVSGEEREKWRLMMEKYFTQCKEKIQWVFLLIDSQVGPTPLDRSMIEFLSSLNIPYVLVLTKGDKADQREKEKTIKGLSLLSKAPIVITSAKEGKGKKELLKFLKVE